MKKWFTLLEKCYWVSEFSGWYADYSYQNSVSFSWLRRDGVTKNTGLWSFISVDGDRSDSYGFRIAIRA